MGIFALTSQKQGESPWVIGGAVHALSRGDSVQAAIHGPRGVIAWSCVVRDEFVGQVDRG